MKSVFKISSFFFLTFINASILAKPWIEWKEKDAPRLQYSQVNYHANKLLPYFEGQNARANCGIATTVMALNSLNSSSSYRFLGLKLFTQSPKFDQSNFFSPQVEKIVKKKEVDRRGISMAELKKALKTYHWLNVYPYEGPRLSHYQLRNLLISSLKNPNQRILGLFDRRILKQRGSGHWSPIAAYDKKMDSFLVLDVANFKYPPFWVKAEALFNSMQTYNGRQPRGLLVIEKINS